MNNDKIPIGIATTAGPDYYHIKLRLRKGIIIKLGDIVTLDMIEPYEPEAVRKVKNYMSGFMFPESIKYDEDYIDRHAREIVKIVQESEDADE